MNYFKYVSLIATAFLLPAVAFAQNDSGTSLSQINNVNNIIDKIAGFANTAVYLLVALAVLYIVYYTVMYFIKGKEGDEGRREAGMQILWGVVGLFVIISIWGLVNILVNTFPVGDNQAPTDRFPNADFLKTNSSSANPYNATPVGGNGAYYDTPVPNPSSDPGLTPS